MYKHKQEGARVSQVYSKVFLFIMLMKEPDPKAISHYSAAGEEEILRMLFTGA